MRKLLFTLVCLFTTLLSHAEQALDIHFFNGSSAQVFIGSSPKMRFSGDLLELSSDDINGAWEISEVSYFTFIDVEPTATRNKHTDSQLIIQGDLILIREDWARVAIYSSAGVLLESHANDETLIDLTRRCPGVYILTVETIESRNSYKIIR